MPAGNDSGGYNFKILHTMSTIKKWVVLTSGKRSLTDISKELKKKGFVVGHVLKAIGQITGEATDDIKHSAEDIDGITDIFQSHDDIELGDPDSPVTW